MFVPYPLTHSCSDALSLGHHVVLGISPFNSYFSETRIQQLAAWGLRHFTSIHLFVPDVPAAYTLEALGYAPNKAEKKARRQANYLRNKILRALAGLEVPPNQAAEIIVFSDRLVTNKPYQHKLQVCKQAYHTHPSFRNACHEAARWVLQNHISSEASVTPAMLETAARYLLAELPLFIDSVSILGRPSSVFCYHQSTAFLQQLYEGRFPVPVSPGQGFVRLEPLAVMEPALEVA